MYTTVTLVVVLLLMRFAFKTTIMGTAKISLSCGVVVIVRVVVMPSNQAENSKILRHLALAAVFQFKIPRPYIVRNFLKPATASRLLKPSNQMR